MHGRLGGSLVWIWILAACGGDRVGDVLPAGTTDDALVSGDDAFVDASAKASKAKLRVNTVASDTDAEAMADANGALSDEAGAESAGSYSESDEERRAERRQPTRWFSRHSHPQSVTPLTDRFGQRKGHAERPLGGQAVAVLDIEVDGAPDMVLVNGSPYVFAVKNRWTPRRGMFFETERQPIGTTEDNEKNKAKGLASHDFDDDGKIDVYLANQGVGTPLYYKEKYSDAGKYRSGQYNTKINKGTGQFRDVDLGLNAEGSTRTALFADFDSDGNIDAYVSVAAYFGRWYTGSTNPNQLYPGRDDGKFGDNILSDVMLNGADDLFVDDKGRATKNFKGSVVRDFDGDGRPDIITGAIADIWAKTESDLTTPGWVGYQGDWGRGLWVLHNASSPGRIRFRDVSRDAVPNANGNTDQMHVYAALPVDIDNDADLDLFVTGYKGRFAHNSMENNTPIIRVLRNESRRGQIRFVDATEEVGLAGLNDAHKLPGIYPIKRTLHEVSAVIYPQLHASVAIDADNDGDMDIIAVDRQIIRTGHKADPWVFRNNGPEGFELMPPRAHGLNNTGRELSYGDFNLDGRVDLVVVDGNGMGVGLRDTNTVWLNEVTNDNGYIALKSSEYGNRSGLGAKVTVRASGTETIVGYDEVRTDFCYRSKRENTVYFGTGDVEKVDVAWQFPGGNTVQMTSLDAGKRYRLLVGQLREQRGQWFLAGDMVLDVSKVDVTTLGCEGKTPLHMDLMDVDSDGYVDLPLLLDNDCRELRGMLPEGTLASWTDLLVARRTTQ